MDDDVAYDDALHHVREVELPRAEEWDRASYSLRPCGREPGNRGAERYREGSVVLDGPQIGI